MQLQKERKTKTRKFKTQQNSNEENEAVVVAVDSPAVLGNCP